MQKFWKSVKIWQSYREFKGGPFLRHSVLGAQKPFPFPWEFPLPRTPLMSAAIAYLALLSGMTAWRLLGNDRPFCSGNSSDIENVCIAVATVTGTRHRNLYFVVCLWRSTKMQDRQVRHQSLRQWSCKTQKNILSMIVHTTLSVLCV